MQSICRFVTRFWLNKPRAPYNNRPEMAATIKMPNHHSTLELFKALGRIPVQQTTADFISPSILSDTF